MNGRRRTRVAALRLRVLVALALVPALGLAGAAAPEHLHEADADHPHAAAHRHLTPHAADADDHDHALLTHDEAHILYFDTVGECHDGFQFEAPALQPVASFWLMPAFAEWAAPPDYDTAPPHGPPRAVLALRGPPRLAA